MKLMQMLQNAARWYFTASGLLFNMFAVISVVGLVVGNDQLSILPYSGGLLDPLQNVATCSRALSGAKIAFETETPFAVLDAHGRKRDMVLLGQRSFISGTTKEGHQVIQSQARAVSGDVTESQHLAFEVTSEGEIVRCLPSPLSAQARMTECLAAAGIYDTQGDCLLKIQLPSDCQVMGGRLEDENVCRVPRHGRLLNAGVQVSETK